MTQQTAAKDQTKLTNWEIFFNTVQTLRYSQGFYSRIADQLEVFKAFDPTKLEAIKTELNSLPQWNDTLDCIMYLEG